ncbi:phosphotransferase [Paenibacillus sp. FSL W8-0194]|uniref:phosphotransferase enzyme family protein n=1 Tax=Paenibacillus sp. FSL W8-0194 TaxID=2921711 RepID=UPI0030D98845
MFRQWGETMGKMHRHSKSFTPVDTVRRREGWLSWKTNNPCLHEGKYRVLLQKLRSIEQIIESLPRDQDSYGLIHYDFHPYNFHIDGDGITVFDFDDSIYGWFSLDIAIAAAHAVWWGSPKEDRTSKNEFASAFLDDFLEGYLKQNHLDRYWIQLIPMFMEYRNVSSFFWWLYDWNGDESTLNESQKHAVAKAAHLIEKGLPFDGCEIQL